MNVFLLGNRYRTYFVFWHSKSNPNYSNKIKMKRGERETLEPSKSSICEMTLNIFKEHRQVAMHPSDTVNYVFVLLEGEQVGLYLSAVVSHNRACLLGQVSDEPSEADRNTDLPLLSSLYDPEATTTSQVENIHGGFVKLVHCWTPTACIKKHGVPDITILEAGWDRKLIIRILEYLQV